MTVTTDNGTDDTEVTKYPIAEENGEWVADLTAEGTFGASFKHDLGDNIIFMALPFNGGWHTMGECHTMLSGQAYAKKVEQYLEENGTQFRAISLVSLTTGEDTVVWETDQKWRL